MRNPNHPTKDICVLCGKETEYDRDTPIDLREGYVEGCGQVCTKCRAKEIENQGTRRRYADVFMPWPLEDIF